MQNVNHDLRFAEKKAEIIPGDRNFPMVVFVMHLIRIMPAEGYGDSIEILAPFDLVGSFGFMADQYQLFLKEISQTDWQQWAAVSLGVAEVLFAKANKIWLYPTGILSILLSAFILVKSGLYAECLLNGYYLIMSLYGWWYWLKKRNRLPVKITACDFNDWVMAVLISIGGFAVLAILLNNFTPSTVPYWDALVSSTAWAGMWLLAKRKIENWLLLNISNIIAVPLLLYKQLPLYAALTIFLFVVTIQGFIKWRKIMCTEKKRAILLTE